MKCSWLPIVLKHSSKNALLVFSFQVVAFEGLLLHLCEVFIGGLNHTSGHPRRNAAARNGLCHDGPSAYYTPITYGDSWENHRSVTYIDIISNNDWRRPFKVRYFLPKNQCASIMCDKHHSVGNMHVVTNRNQPWFGIEHSWPNCIETHILPHLYSQRTNISVRVDFSVNLICQKTNYTKKSRNNWIQSSYKYHLFNL